jgi:hypothetical protein
MRAFDRDLIRGGHYGQRSREPRSQAEHMAAPTNAAGVKKPLPTRSRPHMARPRTSRDVPQWGKVDSCRWRVELSQTERDELTAWLSGGKHAARRLKRAQILLAADSGPAFRSKAGAAPTGIPLCSQACQLAKHGRDRDRCPRCPMPRSSHREHRTADSRDHRVGASAQFRPSPHQLDVHNRKARAKIGRAYP